ncbi:hypothetical protein [Streptomyces sp. cg35]|uniref:hypothetical protein n=1 Tax=Streptomyces sp. cg35 TaxID=3421650 RepID=UPI003D17114C
MDWRPGNERSTGLLVHNGPGLAMATLDACPGLRWALDLTGLVKPVPYEVRNFLLGAARTAPVIAGALVFFADKPDAALDALVGLSGYPARFVFTGNVPAFGQPSPPVQYWPVFDDFADAVNRATSTATNVPAQGSARRTARGRTEASGSAPRRPTQTESR